MRWPQFAIGSVFFIDTNQIGVLDDSMARRKGMWQLASEFGVDMTLLQANLEKSPTRRVRDHLNALALAEKLRQAGRKRNARIRKAS
jgi:hypothetical protein